MTTWCSRWRSLCTGASGPTPARPMRNSRGSGPRVAKFTRIGGDGVAELGVSCPRKRLPGFLWLEGSVLPPSPPVAGDGGPTGRTALLPSRSSGEVMPLVGSRSVGHLLRFTTGGGGRGARRVVTADGQWVSPFPRSPAPPRLFPHAPLSGTLGVVPGVLPPAKSSFN
jgi:hypothetical protein